MFHKARLKLTAWYLLIIMLICVFFSLVIYQLLCHEVDRFSRMQRLRIERRFQTEELAPPDSWPNSDRPFLEPELVEETKGRITLFLIGINSIVLLLSGGLGYFLAGRTLQPIKEMVDEQNRFISDASHELRTPLTVLKSSLEVNLRDKKLNLTGAKKIMSESIEEVDKLQSLSEALLQIIQFQKPNNKMVLKEVSLKEIFQQAVAKMKSLAQKKKITIKNNLREYKLRGDKYSLRDLLVILLDNAIKYSRENTSITLTSTKTDGFIAITIQDEGIGISEKELPLIFDRFYRADGARSKSTAAGYGLGLAIAKEIVDLHHGSISVASKLNKGSSFTIKLPLKDS